MKAHFGKKWKSFILVSGLLVALSACSSSETKNEGDEFGEPAPSTEASTDAVPQDSVEAPPGSPANDTAVPAAPTEDATAAPPPGATEEAAAPAPGAGDSQDSAPAPGDLSASAEASAPAAAEAPAARPVATSISDADSYKVKKGDTLMMIAFETYGDLFQWRKIFDNNRDKIKDPNHIPPGTTLKLERGGKIEVSRNGEQYLIKKGDTLGTISKDVYGTPKKWKALWENNKELIHDPNKIFAGFYLYYTGAPAQPQQENKPAPLAKKKPPVAPTASAPTDSREPSSIRGTWPGAQQHQQQANRFAQPAVAQPPAQTISPPPPAAVQPPPAPPSQPAEAPAAAPSFWERLKKWK